MQQDNLFRIILAIVFTSFIAHRAYYSRKVPPSDQKTLEKFEENLLSKLAGMLSLPAFIALVIYFVNPKLLAWASLPMHLSLRWLGVAFASLGFVLLQWSQTTLGSNWSDQPRIIEGQQLIKHGPYRWIRHPIYTAFILILGPSFLISANWLVGGFWIIMISIEIYNRVNYEEVAMITSFGDEYLSYKDQTGRLIPRLFR